MWKRVVPILIFTQVLTFNTVGIANEVEEPGVCSTHTETKIEKNVGSYRIRISYSDERMCQHLDISKSGKVLFHEDGFDNHYFLGSRWIDRDRHIIRNMTGHGTQLIVSKWTGGAHCCMSLLIFNLGTQIGKIAEIEGGNFEPEIVDLNHDGIPEIRITDDFLAYRFSSFATSAWGSVILKYSNGDLVFTGNAKEASQLVDRVWPDGLNGKDDFLKSYREALGESRYYSKAVEQIR